MHGLNGNVPIPASNSIIAAFTARGAAIGPATPFTKQTVNYSNRLKKLYGHNKVQIHCEKL
jgi:hypothetical protein